MSSAPGNISVEPMAPRHLDGATRALASAFQNDPLISYLAPDAEQRRRWLPIVMRHNLGLTAPFEHNYAAIDAAGEVVGAMGVYPPGKSATALGTALYMAQVILRPAPWVPPLPRLFKSLRYSEEWERMRIKEPHWYVYLIGVDAARHGRGVGRELMRRAAKLAGESGMPLYLETQNERNLAFYRACGLEVVVQSHPVPEGPPSWGMLAKP